MTRKPPAASRTSGFQSLWGRRVRTDRDAPKLGSNSSGVLTGTCASPSAPPTSTYLDDPVEESELIAMVTRSIEWALAAAGKAEYAATVLPCAIWRSQASGAPLQSKTALIMAASMLKIRARDDGNGLDTLGRHLHIPTTFRGLAEAEQIRL
jgi:hypothetical protein